MSRSADGQGGVLLPEEKDQLLKQLLAERKSRRRSKQQRQSITPPTATPDSSSHTVDAAPLRRSTERGEEARQLDSDSRSSTAPHHAGMHACGEHSISANAMRQAAEPDENGNNRRSRDVCGREQQQQASAETLMGWAKQGAAAEADPTGEEFRADMSSAEAAADAAMAAAFRSPLGQSAIRRSAGGDSVARPSLDGSIGIDRATCAVTPPPQSRPSESGSYIGKTA